MGSAVKRVGRWSCLVWILLLCACAGTEPVRTETVAAVPDRDAVTLRMVQLAQAGRVGEARETLRNHLSDHPGDGTMHYNLACLDLLLNDPDEALLNLESALAVGYTNFRLIDNDRSLKPLRDDLRFQDLVLSYETAFRDTFHSRALILEDGFRLEGVPLRSRDSADAETARASTSLMSGRDGLTVSVVADDPPDRILNMPWGGGPGILVNLVRPISPDDYESQRYHSIGIGAEDGEPRAYLVGHDGEVLLKPLPDIVPVIRRSEGEIRFEVVIPWSVFHPYGPPLDQEMGLNVIYLGPGSSSTRTVLSLMPEDRLSFEADPWRRYVPVSFRTSERTEPVIKGRLYDRLIEGETLGVEFVLWSRTLGPGTCRLSILDQSGEPVASIPPVVRKIECVEELNFFDEALDLGDLPTGLYRFEMTVEGPDGLAEVMNEPFSRFTPDWLEDLNVRIYAMTNPESSILRYRLFVIARDLDRRHPQESAVQLHATYEGLVGMIETCEAGGSCLPESGVFVGGFAVDTMEQRKCVLHLPKGHRSLESPRLVIVVPPQPGSEEQLAEELGAALGEDSDVVVFVLQSHGSAGLALDKASRHAELAIEWARTLFPCETVSLVGLGGGADAAMAVSLNRPDLFSGAIICADHLFLEDELFSIDSLGDAPTDRGAGVPYTLVSRLIASERMAAIESVIRDLGYELDVVSVPGGSTDALWVADWIRADDR